MSDLYAKRVSRSFDFDLKRTEDTDEGLILEGYAAVFNSPTLIDSVREGTFTEVIAPGAFAKSLGERTPVLQFDHGSHPMIGSIPLGAVRHIREDEHGLFVRARLSDNWLIQPVRDAIRDGAITGMSFRFAVTRQDEDRSTTPKTRTLREVALYELGPVVFPAYNTTNVGVRSSELLRQLSDPDVRSELATLLTFSDLSELGEQLVESISDTTPRSSDAAPEGTSEEQTDTPPVVAPVGAHKKRAEQARRRLALRFPEIKEIA